MVRTTRLGEAELAGDDRPPLDLGRALLRVSAFDTAKAGSAKLDNLLAGDP